MDVARSSIFCIMTDNSRRRGARRLILSARSSRISDMARTARADCLLAIRRSPIYRLDCTAKITVLRCTSCRFWQYHHSPVLKWQYKRQNCPKLPKISKITHFTSKVPLKAIATEFHSPTTTARDMPRKHHFSERMKQALEHYEASNGALTAPKYLLTQAALATQAGTDTRCK